MPITFKPSTAPGVTRVYLKRRLIGRIMRQRLSDVYPDARPGYVYATNIGDRAGPFESLDEAKRKVREIYK